MLGHVHNACDRVVCGWLNVYSAGAALMQRRRLPRPKLSTVALDLPPNYPAPSVITISPDFYFITMPSAIESSSSSSRTTVNSFQIKGGKYLHKFLERSYSHRTSIPSSLPDHSPLAGPVYFPPDIFDINADEPSVTPVQIDIPLDAFAIPVQDPHLPLYDPDAFSIPMEQPPMPTDVLVMDVSQANMTSVPSSFDRNPSTSSMLHPPFPSTSSDNSAPRSMAPMIIDGDAFCIPGDISFSSLDPALPAPPWSPLQVDEDAFSMPIVNPPPLSSTVFEQEAFVIPTDVPSPGTTLQIDSFDIPACLTPSAGCSDSHPLTLISLDVDENAFTIIPSTGTPPHGESLLGIQLQFIMTHPP
jgi:hypothetical protein